MAVQYDKENNSWSTWLDIFKNKIPQAGNEAIKTFTKINEKMPKKGIFTDGWSTDNWDKWIHQNKLADENLIAFLKDTNYATKDLANYQTYLQNNAKATSTWSKITKGAANIAKGFGAAIASMGVNMAIGMVLDAVVSGLNNLANASENAMEATKELVNASNEQKSKLTDNSSKISELNDEYQSLSDEVNSLGENLHLTSDKYDRYKDIISQVSEIMPDLSVRYNEQGEKIGFVTGRLEDLNREYDKYIQKQARDFLNNGDGNGNTIQDMIDNFNNQSELGVKETFIDSFINKFTGSGQANVYSNKEMIELLNNFSKEYENYNPLLSDVEQFSLGNEMQAVLDSLGYNISDFNKILQDRNNSGYSAIQEKIQATIEKYEESQDVSSEGIKLILDSLYKADERYLSLRENGLSGNIDKIISSMSFESLQGVGVVDENGQTDEKQLRIFKNRIIKAVADNKGDINNALNELFKIDLDTTEMNPAEIANKINQLLDKIAESLGFDDEWVKNAKIVFGLDVADTNSKDFDKILAKFSKEFHDKPESFGSSTNKDDVALKNWADRYNVQKTELEKLEEQGYNSANSIKELNKGLIALRNTQESVKNTFSNVWDSIGTKGTDEQKKASQQAKENLLELAEAGKLTEKELSKSSIANTFTEAKISIANATKEINKMVDSSKQLSSLKSAISSIRDAYGEKRDEKSVGADTLAGMEDTFGSLGKAWENYKSTLGSTSSTLEQCRKAQNDLATAYISSNNFLSQLTKGNKDYYISQLKEMGIANAQNVVTDTLNAKKEVQKNKTEALAAATSDLSGKTNNASKEFLKEATMSNVARVQLANLVAQEQIFNNSELNTSDKIQKLNNLANAYFGVANAIQISSAMGSDPRYYKNPKDYQNAVEKQWNKLVKKQTKLSVDDINVSTKGIKSSKDSKSKSSKTKEEINWLQRALDVIQKKLDTTASKLKNLFSVNAKNKNLDEQIKQIDKQITAYEKVMSKYASKMKQADKKNVFYKDEKKNDDIIRKIKNGKLDGSLSSLISEYGSKRGKKINKYIEYYDNYLDAQQKLEEKEAEKREKQIEKYQNKVDSFDAQAELKGLESENSNDLQTKNKLLSDKISLVQKSYDEQIKIAQLEKDTTKELTLQKKKQQEIIDLKKQQYDNTKEEYDSKIELLENDEQDVRNQLDLLKAKGETVSESVYKDLIAKENVQLQKRIAERTALENASKGMAVNSDEWKQAQQDLQSLDDSISDSQNTIVELNDSIVELDNSITEGVIANNENMKDESDFIANLIQDKDKFESGEFTKEGLATLGSYDVGLKSSQNSTEKYKADREELEKLLAAGQYGDGYKYTSKEKLESAIADTIQKEQDAIQSVYDYESKIIDLMTEKYRSQIDYLNEIVQAKQEALDIEKDLYEYEKNIASKTKDVATIQKQIAALQGDNSEEGRAKRAKLQVELDNVVQDLKDTEYDKKISDQKEMLDNLSAEYEELITKMSKNRDELLKEGIKAVEDNGSLIADTWDEYTSKYNYDYSSNFGTIKDAINGTNGSLASVLQTQASLIISEMKAGNFVNSGNNGGGNTSNNNNDGSSEQKSQSSTTKAGQVANADVYKSASEKGMSESDKRYKKVADILSGSWFSGHGSNKYWVQNPVTSKSDIEKLSKVNKWIRSQKFFEIDGTPTYLTTDGLKRLAKKLGVSYSKDNKTGGIKDYLGFQTGGIIRATGVSDTGDKVLVRVNPNETILTQDFTKLLPETVSAMQNFVKLNIPDYSSLIRKNTSNANTFNGGINLNLELPNVQNANDFVTDLKKNSRARRAFEVAVNDISRNGHITEKITRV